RLIRRLHDAGYDWIEKRSQDVVMFGAVAARPRAAGARGDNVKRRNDQNQTVIETPGPEGISRNFGERAVGIVPPKQPVVVRRVVVWIRIGLWQPDDARHRARRHADEFLGQELPIPPAAIAQ